MVMRMIRVSVMLTNHGMLKKVFVTKSRIAKTVKMRNPESNNKMRWLETFSMERLNMVLVELPFVYIIARRNGAIVVSVIRKDNMDARPLDRCFSRKGCKYSRDKSKMATTTVESTIV